MLTGEPPFPELDVDDEDEIQRRFKRHDFPPLEKLPGGDVIRNYWIGVYDDASEAMVDFAEVDAVVSAIDCVQCLKTLLRSYSGPLKVSHL